MMLSTYKNRIQNRTKLSIIGIQTLNELFLYKCYLFWEEKIFQLRDSGQIGLVLMVVMAEGFLHYHKTRAI